MTPLQTAAAKFALNAINKFISSEHLASVELVDLHIAAGKLSDALEAEQAQAVNGRIGFLYEELRKATDGGSESMTHDDALKQIAYWRDKCSQVQAVVPVCRNCTGAGWEPHVYKSRIPCSHCNPAPPATGERAMLIAELRGSADLLQIGKVEDWDGLAAEILQAVDMLEADAQDAFTVGLACQPKQQALSLDLLERLSRTLTNLGYSTPEGGMEHFGARIESQLYNLCRGVDSMLAQQVAVPVPLSGYEISEWWASENELEDCNMCIHDDFEKVVRAIEARHRIGAKS